MAGLQELPDDASTKRAYSALKRDFSAGLGSRMLVTVEGDLRDRRTRAPPKPAVFAGMAMGDMAMFQQLGFGLAVAIAIDATMVRTVIVPSAMTLFGRSCWYLPRWLRWLPRVKMDEPTEKAARP